MGEKRSSFTTIQHQARIKLGLSVLEYCVADLIHRYSTNPDSLFPGWCYASKTFIAVDLGVTEQGIHKIIKKLLDQNLIEKDPVSKHLRATSRWFNEAYLTQFDTDTKQSLAEGETKFSPSTKQSLVNSNTHSKRDNNAPSGAFVNPFKNLLKKPQPQVKYEWQDLANRIKEKIPFPGYKVSELFRVCRDFPRKDVMDAYSFAVDYQGQMPLHKAFFWRLSNTPKELKEAVS